MPQVSAAVLRSTPSSTSASASIRRAAAPSFSPLAALRSSEAVRSSRVIDTPAPIDAAPLKDEHRVRASLIWESLMSHSFGPLVLGTTCYLCLRAGQFDLLAERKGFEPPIGLHLCRISSAVHSTTLPPLLKAPNHGAGPCVVGAVF